MRKKEETKERSQTLHTEQSETRKSKPPHLRKTVLRKVIPYILVGCITSSAVMMAHNEAREVKAVAVVDDVILLTALLAMAGIAYVGVSEYWTNGQWLEDEDSPVLDPDMAEWGQGFADRMQEQWDDDVLQKAIELGYVDPDTGEYTGALEGTGGSGDDDNDDDKNKFPTWKMLKERLSKNGGNLEEAIGSTMGFVIAGMFASTMLESAEEGAKMPGGLPSDINTKLAEVDAKVNQYFQEKNIDLSEYPYKSVSIEQRLSDSKVWIRYLYAKSDLYAYYKPNGKDISYGIYRKSSYLTFDYSEFFNPAKEWISNETSSTTARSTKNYTTQESYYKFYCNVPICSSIEESMAYYDNPYPVYPDTYINPSTIGKSTALAKKLAETGGNLTESLYKNATLPTTEQLNQYFEDLNNAENEEEKQKVMDEFVDSLVNPTENPDPNPNPDPDNPDKPVIPDNPDNPTNNDTFLADLKHLFPFCIPFDLVDCFKLFNAEPVTPRVEFPVHFGIINYDHTFVIDLKDFDKVAVVCRSTFLIIYMTGLILATRALIKG